MITTNHTPTASAAEDQPLTRLFSALRRRSPGKPRLVAADQRPSPRAVHSGGAVAEWHAMGRTF